MSKMIKEEINNISSLIDNEDLIRFEKEISLFIDRYAHTDLRGNYKLLCNVIERAIKESEHINEVHSKLYYHYGVLLGDIRKNQGDYNNNDISYKIIFSYVEALKGKHIDKQIEMQTYVNIGNELYALGRSLEAISFYEKALEINESFGMALGNKAITLMRLLSGVFDTGHQQLMVYNAFKLSTKALTDKFITNEMKEQLEDRIAYYTPFYEGTFELDRYFQNDIRTSNSEEESEYRNWCSKNKLFINPLNEIMSNYYAQSDPTHLPSFVAKIEDGPYLHGMYNNIKQEYASARYMYYYSMYKCNEHFSDKDVTIIDTLDYSHNSYKNELMKSSFRTLYSILDKIVYFINEFFDVGMEYGKVSYLNIWGFKGDNNESILESRINETGNLYLKAISLICKELSSIGNLGSQVNEARQLKYFSNDLILIIADIRNSMEHKFFRIQEYPKFRSYTKEPEGLAYNISRDDFEDSTLHLLKTIRNAIMYLSMAMKHEEDYREKFRDDKTMRMPIKLPTIDDEWKE